MTASRPKHIAVIGARRTIGPDPDTTSHRVHHESQGTEDTPLWVTPASAQATVQVAELPVQVPTVMVVEVAQEPPVIRATSQVAVAATGDTPEIFCFE